MSASPQDTPIAAIDVGSNTIHLVVARPIDANADLEILADETVLVRLGADVTATGAIGSERAAIAAGVVRRQTELARRLGASPILGLATEGVRKARNGGAFLDQVRAITGVTFALISGEEEAALTFWGATSGQALAGRRAVVDLGGGSMELVVGHAGSITWRVSLPMGSGTIHDQIAPADPADPVQLAAAERLITDALRPLPVPLPVSEVAAVGGSATTLAVLARRALADHPMATDPPLTAPAGSAIQDTLTESVFEALLTLLRAQTAAAIAERYGVEAERARLLAPGAVALRAVMRRMAVDRLRVSRRGIREGAILAYARHGERWREAAKRG